MKSSFFKTRKGFLKDYAPWVVRVSRRVCLGLKVIYQFFKINNSSSSSISQWNISIKIIQTWHSFRILFFEALHFNLKRISGHNLGLRSGNVQRFLNIKFMTLPRLFHVSYWVNVLCIIEPFEAWYLKFLHLAHIGYD